MRVQNERNGSVRPGVVVVTGFDPTGGTVDIHLRHEVLTSNETISTIGRGARSLENGAPPQNLTLPLRNPIQT
jgi:hypothetical protein